MLSNLVAMLSDLVLCSLFWLVVVVQSLRRVGKDTTVLLICVTVFLSYLPEAGQYSSFFLYLRQVTCPSQEALVSGDRSSSERRMCVAGHWIFTRCHRRLHRHGWHPLHCCSGMEISSCLEAPSAGGVDLKVKLQVCVVTLWHPDLYHAPCLLDFVS